MVEEIDRGLAEDFENESYMKKLFWKPRAVARKQLKEDLSDFREKREQGMGHLFGPADAELLLCVDNRNKELAVIDDLIVPMLERATSDMENAADRTLVVASSLATLLAKTFNARSANNSSLIDKCPLFVSKERKANYKTAFFGIPAKEASKRKSLSVRGHNFELKNYTEITFCKLTGEMIGGIGPQGYHCSHCGYDVHKKHVNRVEEPCVGPRQSSKGEKAVKKIMGRIRSDRDLQAKQLQDRKPSTPGAATDWASTPTSSTPTVGTGKEGRNNCFIIHFLKNFFFLFPTFWLSKDYFQKSREKVVFLLTCKREP